LISGLEASNVVFSDQLQAIVSLAGEGQRLVHGDVITESVEIIATAGTLLGPQSQCQYVVGASDNLSFDVNKFDKLSFFTLDPRDQGNSGQKPLGGNSCNLLGLSIDRGPGCASKDGETSRRIP